MRVRHSIGGYREYDPDPAAAFFSDAFWTHCTPSDAVPDEQAAHRILPDPAVSIGFWCLGRDHRGLPRDSGLVLIGAKTRPQLFHLTPGLEYAALRLKLEWVGPVLGIDPIDLDDREVEFSAIHSAVAGRLHEAIANTRSVMEALPVLGRMVTAARASRFAPPAAATTALDIVRRTAGRIPCERVADTVGVSMRHLRRQVHDSTGLSPKAYARTLRLVHAMQLADSSPAPDWAAVAAHSGYCDQSHLIRECVALTGLAPVPLHRERETQRVSERSNTA